MKVGNIMTMPCLDNDKCKGTIKGIYGGDIYIREYGSRIQYSQLMNGKCNCCGKSAYEIRLKANEVTDAIPSDGSAPTSEDSIYPVEHLHRRYKVSQTEIYRRLYALEIKLLTENDVQYIIYDDLWLLDVFHEHKLREIRTNGDCLSFVPVTCFRGLVTPRAVDESLSLNALKSLVNLESKISAAYLIKCLSG